MQYIAGICLRNEMVRGSKFWFRKKRDCTIYMAKTKALISCAVTVQLICSFVFTYAKIWFSHGAAQIILRVFKSLLAKIQYISQIECCCNEILLFFYQVFVKHSKPKDWSKAKCFEETLIGSILAFSSSPKSSKGPYDFFTNHLGAPKQETETTMKLIWEVCQ